MHVLCSSHSCLKQEIFRQQPRLSHILSLTLSLLSESTLWWIRRESQASHCSKCHSKLITTVSCLAIHSSCSDLEKIDREVATEYLPLQRREKGKCSPAMLLRIWGAQLQWFVIWKYVSVLHVFRKNYLFDVMA